MSSIDSRKFNVNYLLFSVCVATFLIYFVLSLPEGISAALKDSVVSVRGGASILAYAYEVGTSSLVSSTTTPPVTTSMWFFSTSIPPCVGICVRCNATFDETQRGFGSLQDGAAVVDSRTDYVFEGRVVAYDSLFHANSTLRDLNDTNIVWIPNATVKIAETHADNRVVLKYELSNGSGHFGGEFYWDPDLSNQGNGKLYVSSQATHAKIAASISPRTALLVGLNPPFFSTFSKDLEGDRGGWGTATLLGLTRANVLEINLTALNADDGKLLCNISYDSTFGDDSATNLAVDSQNNIYAAGYQANNSDGTVRDWHLKKFNENCTEITSGWRKTIYGVNASSYSNAVDSLISTNSSFWVGTETGSNWWVKKFDPVGTEHQTTWNKTPTGKTAWAVAQDSGLNIYVVGENASGSMWINKYDKNGTVDDTNWNKVYPGTFTTSANPLYIDASDNVYVVSTYGGSDWWIKKFNSSGSELSGWNFTEDDGGTEQPTAIAGDYCGSSVYVTGTSGTDWWIKKYYSNGTEDTSWNKSIDGGGADVPYSVDVDSNNNLYVAGYRTNSSSDKMWWLKKYDPAGTENTNWNKSLYEGNGSALSLVVDWADNVWAGGYFGDDWRIKKFSSGIGFVREACEYRRTRANVPPGTTFTKTLDNNTNTTVSDGVIAAVLRNTLGEMDTYNIQGNSSDFMIPVAVLEASFYDPDDALKILPNGPIYYAGFFGSRGQNVTATGNIGMYALTDEGWSYLNSSCKSKRGQYMGQAQTSTPINFDLQKNNPACVHFTMAESGWGDDANCGKFVNTSWTLQRVGGQTITYNDPPRSHSRGSSFTKGKTFSFNRLVTNSYITINLKGQPDGCSPPILEGSLKVAGQSNNFSTGGGNCPSAGRCSNFLDICETDTAKNGCRSCIVIRPDPNASEASISYSPTCPSTGTDIVFTVYYINKSDNAHISDGACDLKFPGDASYYAMTRGESSYTYTKSSGFPSAANYTVLANCTSPSIKSYSISIIVQVAQDSGAPVANFSASPTTCLAPLFVEFTDTSTGGDINNYRWDFDNDASWDSYLKNPNYTYGKKGSYTVVLNVTGCGGSDVETKSNYITVNPGVPKPPRMDCGQKKTGSFSDISKCVARITDATRYFNMKNAQNRSVLSIDPGKRFVFTGNASNTLNKKIQYVHKPGPCTVSTIDDVPGTGRDFVSPVISYQRRRVLYGAQNQSNHTIFYVYDIANNTFDGCGTRLSARRQVVAGEYMNSSSSPGHEHDISLYGDGAAIVLGGIDPEGKNSDGGDELYLYMDDNVTGTFAGVQLTNCTAAADFCQVWALRQDCSNATFKRGYFVAYQSNCYGNNQSLIGGNIYEVFAAYYVEMANGTNGTYIRRVTFDGEDNGVDTCRNYDTATEGDMDGDGVADTIWERLQQFGGWINTGGGSDVSNTPPSLDNASVSPTAGSVSTTFNFSVNYSDADNDAPSKIRIHFGDSQQDLVKGDTTDVTYTDGVIYFYADTLASRSYNVTFWAIDSRKRRGAGGMAVATLGHDPSNHDIHSNFKFTVYPTTAVSAGWQFLASPVTLDASTLAAVGVSNNCIETVKWNPGSAAFEDVSTIPDADSFWLWCNSSANLTWGGNEEPLGNVSISALDGCSENTCWDSVAFKSVNAEAASDVFTNECTETDVKIAYFDKSTGSFTYKLYDSSGTLNNMVVGGGLYIYDPPGTGAVCGSDKKWDYYTWVP